MSHVPCPMSIPRPRPILPMPIFLPIPSDPGPDFGIQKKTWFVGHAKAVIAPACVKQTRIQTSNGQLLTLTLRAQLPCTAIGTFTGSGLMHVFCSHGCLCGVFVTTPGSTAVRRERDRDQRVLPPPLRTLLFHFLLYVCGLWLGIHVARKNCCG